MGKYVDTWSDESSRLLRQWQTVAAGLGIDVTSERTRMTRDGMARTSAPNDGISVREALRFAVEHAGSARDVTIPAGTVAVLPPVTVTQGPATNPIRALREKAGLSQVQMAQRMGVARRTVQIAEARASVSAAMMLRATKAIGGGR